MKKFIYLMSLVIVLASCSGNLVKVTVESHNDGTPKLERYFKGEDLKVLKKEISYYQNGQIKMTGQFKRNQKNGAWKYYYSDGTLWSEGRFEEDERNGYGITYHENGNKYIVGNYEDGTRVKKWKFFDEDGTLLKEIDYDN